MQVPMLGVKSELQLLDYPTATAIWGLSCICDQQHSSFLREQMFHGGQKMWCRSCAWRVCFRKYTVLEKVRFCWGNIQPHYRNGLPPQRLASCSDYMSTVGQLQLCSMLESPGDPADEAASSWNLANLVAERKDTWPILQSS